MCLIFIAHQQHQDWPLIIASNRDEFLNRPTEPGHFWGPQFNLLAGRDQEHGGTWMAINRQGRFAAVTNYRDPNQAIGKVSRGQMVTDFINTEASAKDYVSGLNPRDYTGFNFLAFDGKEFFYTSNKAESIQELTPGIYGLSNHLLDTPWPKVVSGKQRFAEIIDQQTVSVDDLFDLMTNTDRAATEDLPSTGVSLELEHHLSSRFITPTADNIPDSHGNYGTRTSTIILIDHKGHGRWYERNHDQGLVSEGPTAEFEW